MLVHKYWTKLLKPPSVFKLNLFFKYFNQHECIGWKLRIYKAPYVLTKDLYFLNILTNTKVLGRNWGFTTPYVFRKD